MITWALSGVSWSHFGCSRDNMASCLHLPTYFRSKFEKLKYYPFLPLNTCQMGWEWWNIEKINWFLSFWVHGVKKLPVYVIRNINFKPIFRHDFAFFSNDFRNKKNPYRVHQVNFLLQNINDGDKMKAWKHLTHHGMTKSYGWKVHFSCLGTLKNSILMRLA